MAVSDSALNLTLRPDPSMVAVARQAVDRALPEVPPAVSEDVRLMVSELVTNSIRHANLAEDEQVTMTIAAGPGTVRVEVADPGRGFDPAALRRGELEGSGWGLYLVGRLADRWGVERNDLTRVWFEIAAPLRRARGRRPAFGV
jgi:anti-sigma regulatory factor (Ser/Thr protein kinase)